MTDESLQRISDRLDEMGLPVMYGMTDHDLYALISTWVHQGGLLVVRHLDDQQLRVDLFQKPGGSSSPAVSGK